MTFEFNDAILQLYQKVSALKRLSRQGWIQSGIEFPESVAEHSFGVSMLALIFARRLSLDVEKALSMALIHELAEAELGDVTPRDNIDAEKKREMEEQAMMQILSEIDPKGELLELWRDFEYQRTPEGQLVKELDRIEMALQALEYERETEIDLDEFFVYVKDRVQRAELVSLLNSIVDARTGS